MRPFKTCLAGRALRGASLRSLAVLALAVTAALPARATEGYFALGYSPADRAQAGAGVAYAGGPMSATRNPAGVATLGRWLAFGAEVFAPRRGYEGTGTGFVPQGDVISGKRAFLIPNLGYNHPLNDRSGVNLTIYGNGGLNTDYPTGLRGCGSVYCSGSAGVDLTQLFVSLGYARRDGIVDWGIAPTLAVQRFAAKGLGAFSGISVRPDRLTDRDAEMSYGLGLRLGAQVQVTPTLRLGVAGQTRFRMSKFDNYAGLFEDGGRFDVPAQLTFGMALQVRPDLTLLADVQRIFYSGVPAIANAGNAGPLGAKGGAGFGWNNVDVLRLGAIWQQSADLTLRAGYAHATSPLGPEDVTLNIIAPGVVRNHFSIGATRRLNDRDKLDMTLVYVPEVTLTGPEVTPMGPTGGTVKLKMRQIGLSVGWRRTF